MAALLVVAARWNGKDSGAVDDLLGWKRGGVAAVYRSGGNNTDIELVTTINITNSFTVNAQEVINANLIINGNGHTISMGLSSDRLLFIAGGTVSISDLTFKNGEAIWRHGTQGGGGGAGLGGAILVGSGSCRQEMAARR